MEERQTIVCQYCGTESKNDSAFCEKCGRKIIKNGKKLKWWMIVLIVTLFIISGMIGTFIYLLKNGKLYEKGYLSDIFRITGLCVEHHYVEADCVNPETCEICGITRGEPKGHSWKEADCINPETCEICLETRGTAKEHIWVEATCEKPKKCSVCFEKEGEPIGHTVLMGKCGNCGEYQYELEDEFRSIIKYCEDGNDYADTAVSFMSGNISSVSSAYLACSSASYYYSYAKAEYQKAYNLCGRYEEFRILKIKIKAIIDACPTSEPSNNRNSCIEYLEKAEDCLYKEMACAEYTLKLLKDWDIE